MKLGPAGNMTRSVIGSALTPLFLIAALARGLVALVTHPREEEPQISVPMVDIPVAAPGLRAEEAVKLVTEPLGTIGDHRQGHRRGGAHLLPDPRRRGHGDGALPDRHLVGRGGATCPRRGARQPGPHSGRHPRAPERRARHRRCGHRVPHPVAQPAAAKGVAPADLFRIARELRAEIAEVEDVELTRLVGEARDTIRVAPDPERLALQGVTLQQLAGKAMSANQAFPMGVVREGGQQIEVVAGEMRQTPAGIANLLLTSRDGRPVYVRDVADVADVAFTADTAGPYVSTVTRGATASPGAPPP